MNARLGLQLKAFNWGVWERRRSLGLSQKALSQLIGMDIQFIGRVESLRQKPTQEQADEIASALDCTVEDLFPTEVLARYSASSPATVRIAVPAAALVSLVGTSFQPLSLDQVVERAELKTIMSGALALLNDREARVVRLRFGLEDGSSHTFEEVSRELRVTRERIRQIEAKALRKLRRSGRLREQLLGEGREVNERRKVRA